MKEYEKIEEISKDAPIESTQKNEEDIFATTEIKIEEMAIDGICGVYWADSKTSYFGQSLRWAQILILKILSVFLGLIFLLALILAKLKRFETGSI